MPEPTLPLFKGHAQEEEFPVPKPEAPGAGYAESVAAKVGSGSGEVVRAFHPPVSRTFIHGAPPPYRGGGKK